MSPRQAGCHCYRRSGKLQRANKSAMYRLATSYNVLKLYIFIDCNRPSNKVMGVFMESDYLSSTRRSRKRRLGESGFTLIEIMVVVVILGILAAIIVPRIMDRPDEARIVKTKQDIRILQNALQLYRLDNYVYPTTDQGLESLVVQPVDPPEPKHWREGGYIDRLPKDAWGNPYNYLNPGVFSAIDIFSLGADGQLAGEGVNADIGNWNLE